MEHEINISRYFDPNIFYKKIENIILQNEAVNNQIWGLLSQYNSRNYGSKDSALLYIEDNNYNFLILVLIPSKNLFLTGKGHNHKLLVSYAVDYLDKHRIFFSGITGQSNLMTEFEKKWGLKRERKLKLTLKQGVYQLSRLAKGTIIEGIIRNANHQDLSLVSEWVKNFYYLSLNKNISEDEAQLIADKGINNSTIYLLENQKEVVSMAKKTRETKNGAVISYVYTPLKYRNKGYATSCVYLLSEQLIREGYEFCCLHADLSNPISNKIYESIGYKRIEELSVYK